MLRESSVGLFSASKIPWTVPIHSNGKCISACVPNLSETHSQYCPSLAMTFSWKLDRKNTHLEQRVVFLKATFYQNVHTYMYMCTVLGVKPKMGSKHPFRCLCLIRWFSKWISVNQRQIFHFGIWIHFHYFLVEDIILFKCGCIYRHSTERTGFNFVKAVHAIGKN